MPKKGTWADILWAFAYLVAAEVKGISNKSPTLHFYYGVMLSCFPGCKPVLREWYICIIRPGGVK